MKRNHIFLFAVIISFIIFINSSCSKSGNTANNPGPGGTSSNTVNIAGMAFGPSTITVKMGTTVTWKNSDGFAHTVTSDDGSTFNSGNLAAGRTFAYTTTAAGTFAYHCNIHSNMAGTLVVTP